MILGKQNKVKSKKNKNWKVVINDSFSICLEHKRELLNNGSDYLFIQFF